MQSWAGLECTINRVGADYKDQFTHPLAPTYADFIADSDGLGLSAVRYSVSWERLTDDDTGWRQVGTDLNALRERNIRPIIGLVHHGSGPPTTDLLSADFAIGLAAHARETVRRFPWVSEWTPVNEPLTTARFSALYGLWYPHLHDERSFWLALLNQIDATRLAMREIRAVNPAALLVQTEDLGRTYATAALADQCGFDNTRRWMTWDLLCGMVTTPHPFWDRLVDMGFRDRLDIIADDPCPPDIIGVNHYLTSDRFLDHRTRNYPPEQRGAHYADVEAIRVLRPAPSGLRGALHEAWQRYAIPLAVTECHNACTREEQMRWTAEAWDIAHSLRAEGIGILAVTAWAATGSRNWASLLTRDDDNHYECGIFDSRDGSLHPTAMVPLLQSLARGEAPDHPVLAGRGWWHRDIRFLHAPSCMAAPVPAPESAAKARHLLIVDGNPEIVAACRHRGLSFALTSDASRHAPWAIVEAADWTGIDIQQSLDRLIDNWEDPARAKVGVEDRLNQPAH